MSDAGASFKALRRIKVRGESLVGELFGILFFDRQKHFLPAHFWCTLSHMCRTFSDEKVVSELFGIFFCCKIAENISFLVHCTLSHMCQTTVNNVVNGHSLSCIHVSVDVSFVKYMKTVFQNKTIKDGDIAP